VTPSPLLSLDELARLPDEERLAAVGAAMLYPWHNDELIMALRAFGDGGNEQSCVRFAPDVPDRAAAYP
jgi:hypothetical protein